jgi:hypothetical protein
MIDTAPRRPHHRIAIIQSAYIPWRGFFDLIGRCDEYVIFDSVQYAKRHWHNRNLIKTPNGSLWITIPVATKSRFEQSIEEVTISAEWAERHWRTLVSNYSRAPHFTRLAPQIESLYESASQLRCLTAVNELFLRALCNILGIRTLITRDGKYEPVGARSDRLIDICRKAGATHYLSGPSARAYLEEEKFTAAGIAVEWMTYGDYPVYAQCWGGYEPALSVLDLLFNIGEAEPRFWRREGEATASAALGPSGAAGDHAPDHFDYPIQGVAHPAPDRQPK